MRKQELKWKLVNIAMVGEESESQKEPFWEQFLAQRPVRNVMELAKCQRNYAKGAEAKECCVAKKKFQLLFLLEFGMEKKKRKVGGGGFGDFSGW